MPKISVNEKDLSWYYRQRESSALTVYMPILATFGPDEPVLVDSTNFTQVFGDAPVAGCSKDISYKWAASLVKSGVNVLAHRFIPEGAKQASADILTGKVTVNAKYAGAFGNNLKLKINWSLPYVYLYVINKDTGYTLETVTANLKDPTDPKYFELVNNDTAYIEIAVKSTESLSGGLTEVVLAGGLDISADGDAYDKVCEMIVAPTALTDLVDPYQYSFNVVVDGGFNTYNTKNIATFDAGSWSVVFSQATAKEIKSGSTTIPQGSTSFKLSESLTKTAADSLVSAIQAELDKEIVAASAGVTSIDIALNGLAKDSAKAIYLMSGGSTWDDKVFLTYCGNSQFNNSYVAAYGPWGYAQFITDGSQALLPGSYALLISWAQSLSNGVPLWMAPAGAKRAQLGSFYKSPKYKVGSTILDSWQNQEYVTGIDYKINPIMKLRQYGYCVYGASTLLHNKPDGSTSQLQSVSVRVLCNMIKEQSFDVSLGLQFDKITGELVAQFKSLMGVFMDQLKYGGALFDYEIVSDYSTLTAADLNTKTVPVRIRISPNADAENFDINLEVSQSGISFVDDTDETESA